MLCSFQHYHCRWDLYHCCFFGNYQISTMIRFLTIRLSWLFQTPSGSTIVQSCTIETTQTSITWVSHYSHILNLFFNISLILFPILYPATLTPNKILGAQRRRRQPYKQQRTPCLSLKGSSLPLPSAFSASSQVRLKIELRNRNNLEETKS